MYLQYFYDRQAARPTAVDVETFVRAYEQPGAMRAAFDLYRAFEQDAEDIRGALESGGKMQIPCLGMYGESSLSHRSAAEELGNEIAESVTVEGIAGLGHWIADENPAALIATVKHFDRR